MVVTRTGARFLAQDHAGNREEILESKIMIMCRNNVITYFIQSPVPFSCFPCVLEIGVVVVVVGGHRRSGPNRGTTGFGHLW